MGDESLGRNIMAAPDGTITIGGLNTEGLFIAQFDQTYNLCSEFAVSDVASSLLPTSFSLGSTLSV